MNRTPDSDRSFRPAATDAGGVVRDAVMTVPNVLTIARIAGSGVLLWLAQAGSERWFVGLFVTLVLTDWLDGKLAVLLDQRTELGARLDSVSDFVCYSCLVLGTMWLEPEFVRDEAMLIAAMVGSYALPVLVSLLRFRRLPAYHTRAAKTCWLLVSIGAVTLLLGGPWWPAQVTLIAVIVTNIEAFAIALVLPRWQADVPTIVHALKQPRRG
ncbi:MAG: CDP-alcohol phosphatidyltransferase family protein [Phycisphaerales bacterium]|nr:CDP-alcohol phosphatidyltransferase family protein [Phycisphaerales bacterium]